MSDTAIVELVDASGNVLDDEEFDLIGVSEGAGRLRIPMLEKRFDVKSLRLFKGVGARTVFLSFDECGVSDRSFTTNEVIQVTEATSRTQAKRKEDDKSSSKFVQVDNVNSDISHFNIEKGAENEAKPHVVTQEGKGEEEEDDSISALLARAKAVVADADVLEEEVVVPPKVSDDSEEILDDVNNKEAEGNVQDVKKEEVNENDFMARAMAVLAEADELDEEYEAVVKEDENDSDWDSEEDFELKPLALPPLNTGMNDLLSRLDSFTKEVEDENDAASYDLLGTKMQMLSVDLDQYDVEKGGAISAVGAGVSFNDGGSDSDSDEEMKALRAQVAAAVGSAQEEEDEEMAEIRAQVAALCGSTDSK